MADTQTFDLGLENSAVYGNLKDAESFLSDTSTVIDKGELEKNIPGDKSKEIIPNKEIDLDNETGSTGLINDFLTDTEETPEEEEKPLVKTKTIKDAVLESEVDNESNDDNQFEMLSKELYAAGVFTTEEDEEPLTATSPEEFLALFNDEKKKGATVWLENFLGRFGDDRRELFDAVFVNGVDPKEYVPAYNELADYQSIDLESEINQETIVRSYYKDLGWSEEKISAKVQKLKNTADLEDEAKTVHPIIVDQRKEKLTQISEQKANEQKQIIAQDEDYKKNISTLLQEKVKDKNFNGIPFSEKEAKQAFDFLYSKKWKAKTGELLTDYDRFILETKNPENLTKRIQIALLAMNNFDFSKIEKKAISKESGALFSKLVQKKEKTSNTQHTIKSANSSW